MLLVVLLLFFTTFPLQAVVVGSNTAVSRQALTNFPAADGDNEIRGFAAFEGGVTLENASTSCLYNAFFPIGSTVTLNSGTFNLSQDLILQSDIQIVGAGTINGNQYALVFTDTDQVTLVSASGGGSGETTLTYVDEYIESDRVNSVDWSYDNGYIVLAQDSGNLRILSFNGSTLASQAVDSQSDNAINAVRWHPSDYCVAAGTDGNSGDYELQIWQFNPGTSAFTRTANVNLTDKVKAVAWSQTGSFLAVGEDQNPSRFRIYSFSGGSLTSKVNFSLSSGQRIKGGLSWDSTGNYIAAGCDTNANALRVYSYDGNTSLVLDASVNTGIEVIAVDWDANSSYIAVGLKDDPSYNIRVYEHSSGSLVEKTTARVAETERVYSVAWSSDGNYLAVGLNQGGSGTEFRIYSFDSTNITLTLEHELDVFDDVLSVRWSHDGQYVAVGDKNNEVNVHRFTSGGGGGTAGNFIFNNIKMVFNSDVLLNRTIRFQGVSSVYANGYTMNLGTSGALVVDSGASLLLQDVTLKSISGTNVRCVDSLSTFSLQDVSFILDSDYSFTQGHIDIVGDVTVTGTHVFSYEADQVSTIGSNATWYFDSGTTFSYDPAGGATNLIAFADSSSILHLYETTFYAPSTGIQLTKGKLIVDGECPVISDATLQANGIIFGDGASASNDLSIKILPESGLNLTSGFLVYKNLGG